MKHSNEETYYQRHRLEILKKAKSFREANLEFVRKRGRDAQRRWRQSHTEVSKERNRESYKRWREKHRKEHTARHYAQVCVPLGSNCEFCGDTIGLRRYIPDYDYPKIVVTVCRECRKWIA